MNVYGLGPPKRVSIDRLSGVGASAGVCLLPWGWRGVAAVLAACCVCCGPCRLLCWGGGGVPYRGKHIIIFIYGSIRRRSDAETGPPHAVSLHHNGPPSLSYKHRVAVR